MINQEDRAELMAPAVWIMLAIGGDRTTSGDLDRRRARSGRLAKAGHAADPASC
jgi:hypothetical protein